MGNTVTAQYAYGNALIRKDGEYPLYDGLGSERTVTNASQTVTGTVNFDAFGNTVGSTGSSTSPYMYAATSGYRNDGDAGLVHVGARYYDAQVGRFLSRDTEIDEHPSSILRLEAGAIITGTPAARPLLIAWTI